MRSCSNDMMEQMIMPLVLYSGVYFLFCCILFDDLMNGNTFRRYYVAGSRVRTFTSISCVDTVPNLPFISTRMGPGLSAFADCRKQNKKTLCADKIVNFLMTQPRVRNVGENKKKV